MNRQRSFVLLCGIGVLSFLSYNQVRMPALALFAESLGAGPEGIGVIVSVSTLTGVLLKLPSGALSDIYGRRVLLRIGLLAFALPPFAYPFVTDLETLTLLRFFHGFATALFAPSALATVAELYQERRGAALGWYTASTQAGALLGPVLGGWLIYGTGFATTFASAGMFGLIGLVLLLSFQLESPPQRVPQKALRSTLADMSRTLSQVAKNVRVVVTSVTDAAKMLAKGALMAFLPIYGISVGLNAGEVGLLLGVQGITSLLAKPIMGRVSDLVGRRPLIIIGLIICAISFVMVPQVSDLGMLLTLAALFGLGDAIITSSTAALVADLSEPKAIGAGMGFQGTIGDAGHASGPLLAGVFIGQLDFAWAFAIIASIQLAATAVFAMVVRR